MRVLLVCLCLVSVALTGCRKKSSPEFYKLEQEQSVLVAREGDDAWLSAEMDAIVTGLQAIPDDAKEKARADALLATITAEQTRVKAEQKPPPSAPAPVEPVFAPSPPPEEPVAAEPGEGEADAGEATDAGEPQQPWTGMDEKTFQARFGSCFKPGAKVTLPTGKPASSWVVLTSKPDCQKQFGAPNGVLSYLFTEKGLWGKATETTQIVDAGMITIPAPPQPPPPPAPPPILTTPGAPQPEGYQKAPLAEDAG